MKLLLVSGSDDIHNLISLRVKPLGFELIRYSHVIKAMDNIDEIDPAAIVISARDFPRHWKTMVQFVRNERAKDDCPIILLRGENFPTEEASKASFLGVSGIVMEDLNNPSEADRLQAILGRYIPVDERRRARRFHTEPWQKFGMVFARPCDKALVTGTVKNISVAGMSFLPDIPSLMKDITLNTELGECSLRAGGAILSPNCRLTGTGRIASIEFMSFPEGEQNILNKYLENLPLRAIRDSGKDIEMLLPPG
jgi:hypothetical protein